jgi:glutamate carboxypeptidase
MFPSPRTAALTLALVLAAWAGQPAQADPASDAALLLAAEQEQGALVETLRTLVLIETGSADVAGLDRLAGVVAARLAALGFHVERRKASAGAGADLVIGTLAGTGRQRVMLQAHMDTVYGAGILETQPYKQDGNKLYGPGIADDKGGIAVILHSLKILLGTGWRDFATLTVLFNPDEEVGSPGSGETIAALADQNDTVLSFEPTGAKAVYKNESLLLGASGTATVTLEVKGRASHAGAAPELGRNAIIEIAHELLETRDIAKGIPGVQLNWTNVVSNKATNQIPELATALGDVRITVPGAEQKLLAALEAKVAGSRLVPDTETRVTLQLGRPAFLAGPKAMALATRAQAIYGELGRDLILVPMTGAGTDAGYASRSGHATVVESFGLAGFGYHARDEYIELDSIAPRLYLTTRLLMELGKESD